jgi:hypothetical protein
VSNPLNPPLVAPDPGLAVIRNIERRVIKRALRVVEQGALNATLINDDGRDDQGSEVLLSEREKRVAMDMRKAKRFAPIYIDVLLRRVESAEKADALRAEGPRLGLNVGVFVQVKAAEYQSVVLVEPGSK